MNTETFNIVVGRSEQRIYSSSSLHGQVVHELGRRIVSGAIVEGALLPIEIDLCAEFQVSRTALREGIKVLAAKGLLASRTRTGTRVRSRGDWSMLDPDILAWRMETGHIGTFVQDLYEFRLAVEPLAASLAAVRATEEDIAKMRAILTTMAATESDEPVSIEPDLHFHHLVLAAGRNELLGSLGSMIETALMFSQCKTLQVGKLETLKGHRAVFDAICARDAPEASAAMMRLLDFWHTWNTAVLLSVENERVA